jgi:hypothetical protein
MLDSGLAAYALYEASLARRGCRPPKGLAYNVQTDTGLGVGLSWLNQEERPRVRKEQVGKVSRRRQKVEQAREALLGFG